jgi:hypothetical protein
MRRFAVALVLSAPFSLFAQDGVPAFSNQAAAAGVEFKHVNASNFNLADYTAGGTVGDFDRDGRPDLYVISGGGPGPDKLFMNNGDGTFSDEGAAWGLVAHNGKGATTGDYNDDGWLDVYVTSAGPIGSTGPGNHQLLRNNGNRSFTNVASAVGVNVTDPTKEGGFSAAFGDYDLDGDLDLFVAGHSSNSQNLQSRLFNNDGSGNFTDATAASQIWAGEFQKIAAFCPRFADMDGDRYPELLLVADFGTSRFFENNTDGTFTEAGGAWAAGQEENGMGGTLSDYDNDGLFDWYVTSIINAGSWTGNKLYLNTPANVFNEIAQAAGVDDGGYGWGAVSVDFDHDGFVDLAETNGHNGSGQYIFEPTYVWMSNGDGTYTESAETLGLVHTMAGRGMVDLDYDGDGDQDVAIFANFDYLTLWRNDLSGNEIAWLRVFLDTTANDGLAPDGYGSVISVTVGGQTWWRQLTGGDNFQSCSELVAHFGLGASTLIDELRIDWSDGSSSVLNNVAVNQTLTVAASPDDHWTRLELGTGSNLGVPQIRGSGPLTAGSVTTVTLTSGQPGATAWFVVSAVAVMAPFKGGTLVPAPDFLLPFTTNSQGVVAPALVWPAGVPSGAELYFQVWQEAPSGVLGWTSSNGLRATSP